jgi:site-specific DNA-adenine methylase
VASSRFTERGKSTEQTIDQTTRRHILLDRQQIQKSSYSLYMFRSFCSDICCTVAFCIINCFLYYKPGKFLYNKFVFQRDWNSAMQLEIRRRRDQTKRVRTLERDFRHILCRQTLRYGPITVLKEGRMLIFSPLNRFYVGIT